MYKHSIIFFRYTTLFTGAGMQKKVSEWIANVLDLSCILISFAFDESRDFIARMYGKQHRGRKFWD